MIAKRNAEVAELNALAREQMKAAGRLGAEEIEIGGASFAVGDQIITRINDHRARIYNRERWRVTEVDLRSGQLVLAGIDTRGRVCVDSGYLGRVRERDGGPAIEHAYAATTYQAQGATVDTAFVMADPSMDRQEFYVATSRTREQTYLYATPEVQLDREEIAPSSPYLREGLDHIAEAAERDGSQAAAHDEALRSQFAELSPYDLARRVRELRAEAGAERQNQAAHDRAAEAAREDAARLELLESRGDPHSEARAWAARERIEQLRAEREQLPEVRHGARARAAVAEHVLAERERAAAAAARISPPDYLTRELGERPADPAKQAAWDRGAREVEGYRLRTGIVDRDTALGPKPKDHAAQAEQRRARERLERAQHQLGLQRQGSAERSADFGICL